MAATDGDRPSNDASATEELESSATTNTWHDNRSFYVHRDANEAQWQRPIQRARDRQRRRAEDLRSDSWRRDGRKFYVHRDSTRRQVRPIVNGVETKISVDRAAFLGATRGS